jgi:hypothetical protein
MICDPSGDTCALIAAQTDANTTAVIHGHSPNEEQSASETTDQCQRLARVPLPHRKRVNVIQGDSNRRPLALP